tara:strand:+ start:552 stop:806 length:255 start_codon:yes stop_codon:yes gene_type:complete
MKDKNLPNNFNSLSLDELTFEANKMIDDLESNENLENSEEKYQDLLKLNNLIEKKFRGNAQNINKKTKEKILKITKKKDARRIK